MKHIALIALLALAGCKLDPAPEDRAYVEYGVSGTLTGGSAQTKITPDDIVMREETAAQRQLIRTRTLPEGSFDRVREIAASYMPRLMQLDTSRVCPNAGTFRLVIAAAEGDEQVFEARCPDGLILDAFAAMDAVVE